MNTPKEKSRYRYEEIKPPAKLSGVLDKIWLFNSAAFYDIGKNFRILPDYTSSLIFTSGRDSDLKQIFLAGPNTRSIQIQHFPDQLSCGFRFKPAILHGLLGVSPAVSLDKVIPLNTLINEKSYSELARAFFSAKSNGRRISVFSKFIKSIYSAVDSPAEQLRKYINIILKSGGSVKLESIYSSLKISPRQFQRNFIAATGLAPKEFCKIVRFHTLADKLVKNNFRHYDALVEMGYYDQSHYYREFKEFTGMLPSAFEQRQKRIRHRNLLD